VIVPDVNLLVYAYNVDAPHHDAARRWWESMMETDTPIGLPWVVALGFIRLMTHRSVLVRPVDPGTAVGHVRTWLEQPNVEILEPGDRHLALLQDLLAGLGTAGALTTDAHLAALAIEHRCELHSNDADFARFSGLRWRDPLTSAG
jgi:uncharacterized protein